MMRNIFPKIKILAILISLTQAWAEEGRIFSQNPSLPIPFVDNFDAGTAGEFPPGWDGIYLDADHNFRISENPPVKSQSITEPNVLELFANGPSLNGRSALLFLIFPKKNSLWLKFDFYYDQKTNYFRAGLGDSAVIQFGICGVDSRFLVISRQDNKEVLTPIPKGYLRTGEWNSVAIGRDAEGGHIKINGEAIEMEAKEVPVLDYIKFSIGGQGDTPARLFIDNVRVDSVLKEE